MKAVFAVSLLIAVAPAVAQTCEKDKDDPVPLKRYQLQGGVAKDTRTGLSWLRCSAGQSWDGKGCSGKAVSLSLKDAQAWVATFNAGPAKARHGGSGWRLPTHDELLALVAPHCADPAINSKVFPATVSGPYWTASPAGGATQWAVSFADGFDEIFNSGRTFAVRLVRK